MRAVVVAALAVALNGCSSIMLAQALDREQERERYDEICRSSCVDTPEAPKCREHCPGQWAAAQAAAARCRR